MERRGPAVLLIFFPFYKPCPPFHHLFKSLAAQWVTWWSWFVHPGFFNVSRMADFLRKWFYLIERLSMSAKSELNHLQARIQKIAPLISPPTLRVVVVKEGEALPKPSEITRWDLLVNIEAKK